MVTVIIKQSPSFTLFFVAHHSNSWCTIRLQWIIWIQGTWSKIRRHSLLRNEIGRFTYCHSCFVLLTFSLFQGCVLFGILLVPLAYLIVWELVQSVFAALLSATIILCGKFCYYYMCSIDRMDRHWLCTVWISYNVGSCTCTCIINGLVGFTCVIVINSGSCTCIINGLFDVPNNYMYMC